MLTQISRQNFLNKYPNFPQTKYDEIKDEEEYLYPEVYSNYTLTVEARSVKGKIKAMSTEIFKLMKYLEVDSLIFLGDTKTPWLYQNNDYKPVKEAIQFLVDNKIGKRFNGALEVERSSLPIFLNHFLWLTSCNASLPYFYFTDKMDSFIGTVCQYLNLHLDILNKKADITLNRAIPNTHLLNLEGKKCHNQFSKVGAIKHKQIVITS